MSTYFSNIYSSIIFPKEMKEFNVIPSELKHMLVVLDYRILPRFNIKWASPQYVNSILSLHCKSQNEICQFYRYYSPIYNNSSMITNGHSELLLTSSSLQCQICLMGNLKWFKKLVAHIKSLDPSWTSSWKLPPVSVFMLLF